MLPTPLDLVVQPISLVVFAAYGALMLWEALAPGRPLPKVSGWRGKGLLVFGAYFLVSSYLPLFWDGALARYQLLNLTGLGSVVGTLVGLVVYEIGAWGYHRTMHRVAPLWRVHQTHHSAERVDAASAFLFHPLDMVGWTLLTSLSLVLVVGITPAATTNVLLLVTVLGIFQHTNVKTPRWLGYLVQRPESHSVHHSQGIHDRNYADLPIIDLALGTFENPAHFADPCGLYPGASKQNLDLLLLRDVAASIPEQARVASTTG